MFLFSPLISSLHFDFQMLALLENCNLKKRFKRLEFQQGKNGNEQNKLLWRSVSKERYRRYIEYF